MLMVSNVSLSFKEESVSSSRGDSESESEGESQLLHHMHRLFLDDHQL